jgi:hypothetical protein
MGPGDEAATAHALKGDFSERYRDLGPRAFRSMRHVWHHRCHFNADEVIGDDLHVVLVHRPTYKVLAGSLVMSCLPDSI